MIKKLTKEIQDFLSLEERTEQQILQGAMILLRINRNRVLNQQICRRPKRFEKKLVYELNKHLAYRLDGMTLQEVRRMDGEVLNNVDEILDKGKPDEDGDVDNQNDDTAGRQPKLGRRADHAALPPEIQALWDRNAGRWKKIKEARATVETLDMPCDRYEYLKFMKEAYTLYKQDMAKYDSYKTDASPAASTPDKEISSARAYISKQRKNYENLLAEDLTDKAAALKEKLQQRVDVLLNNKAALSSDLKVWLTEHNFDVPTGED